MCLPPLVEDLHTRTGTPIDTLMTLHKDGHLQHIPQDAEGQLTSVGTMAHQTGSCLPCLFWFKKACTKGIFCDYCHVVHDGQKPKRIRPSRRTRMARRIESSKGEMDSLFDVVLDSMGSQEEGEIISL
mmetsp:Transcript_74469/g.209067  ORF Transcript_74469/g.209067 Transcript_74469/m.209067 type:complete len:128 (+) Transcript_74469:3-386(+)